MSEIVLRLLIVGAVVMLALISTMVFRRRNESNARINQSILGPGIYLFSSTNCLSCEEARRVMTEKLGEGGFDELTWEADAHDFQTLGIDQVPAVLEVIETGRSTLHRGVPEPGSKLLSP